MTQSLGLSSASGSAPSSGGSSSRSSSYASRAPSPNQIADALGELARTARELLAIEPDMPVEDAQLYADCLEAESSGDPMGVLDRLVHAAVQDECDAEAIRLFRTELAERLARKLQGAVKKRAGILRFIEHLQLRTLPRPTYSLSVSERTHVIPTLKPEELPPKFQRVTYEADKHALAAALKAGEEVPAEWSNPEPHLSIRIK